MINASLDATAAAMQWALCLVAQCTAAQERLRQELVLASIGRKELPVEEAELPFTEMVVHESLRLYPPNWMLIPRRCSEDSELGNCRVPRGSWLYIFPYVIHRDARWFTRPVLFDPDRFALENLGVAQRSAFKVRGDDASRERRVQEKIYDDVHEAHDEQFIYQEKDRCYRRNA